MSQRARRAPNSPRLGTSHNFSHKHCSLTHTTPTTTHSDSSDDSSGCLFQAFSDFFRFSPSTVDGPPATNVHVMTPNKPTFFSNKLLIMHKLLTLVCFLKFFLVGDYATVLLPHHEGPRQHPMDMMRDGSVCASACWSQWSV